MENRKKKNISVGITFPIGQGTETDIESPSNIVIHRMSSPEPDENETFAFLAAAALSHVEFIGETSTELADNLYECLVDAYSEFVLKSFIDKYQSQSIRKN